MKRFWVYTYRNKGLINTVLSYGKSLGYDVPILLLEDAPDIAAVSFWEDGSCDPFTGNFYEHLTLDDFFQLTPDDVRDSHTMTLDGKDIPLSEESYQALKKHFSGEGET